MITKDEEEKGLTVTINTTEDCNLRCAYCYEICKKNVSLEFEKYTKFIDLLLNSAENFETFEKNKFYKQGLIIDFIGGDSLIDPDFLDKCLTYLQEKLLTTNTPVANYWKWHWVCSISSNGTLFTPKAKAFMNKWQKKLSVGVSIDGCPEIHDKYRVFPDGSGTMSKILEDWDWYCNWAKDSHPGKPSIKATLSKASIPYIYESLKYVYETLKMDIFQCNFIMENMHLENSDLEELKKQLDLCIPYVLEHRHDLYFALFDYEQYANHKLSTGDEWEKQGHCGSGCMPALGINGNIYPCFRWLQHTQKEGVEPMICGNVNEGWTHFENFNKVSVGAYKCNCTKEEKCKTCIYESACPYCIGGCYSEFGEFRRTTYICEVIKILCEYAKKYWREYDKLEGTIHTFKSEEE